MLKTVATLEDSKVYNGALACTFIKRKDRVALWILYSSQGTLLLHHSQTPSRNRYDAH